MLSQESLSQLKGLKSQMEAEKERAEAVVKGTQSRYGFAILDDGREIFIPPPEMLKAFPNDRVQVCIRPAKDNKTIAEIERLVDSPLAEFTGRCVRKGKALFVDPDVPRINRWLFLPPHARNGAKEGDFLRCAILRHPIRDGKPQAKVLSVLGDEASPGIENRYSIAKYGLAHQWTSAAKRDLAQRLEDCQPLETDKRRNLTDLEFVSIDAAKTQDIDDALYAEISSDGWTLYVAIADPTAYIGQESPLLKEVAQRGTSVYFHGDILPMLPEELSQDTCALAEGVDRAALVCKVAITDDGTVGDFEFIEARVRSRAKLSYFAVDRYLNGQYDELMSHATPLEALYQVYRALRARREEQDLVMEERREYRWILGEDKQIDSIEPSEKMLSQKLVEECMVAANRCAARYLCAGGASGPFVSHAGFKPDRVEELRKFLDLHAPELSQQDPGSLSGYRTIMRGLAHGGHALPLRAMVNRLMSRAELSTEPKLHMGMTMDSYTNCTSPLRKFVDFLAHLQIKALLHGDSANKTDEAILQRLSAQLAVSRSATLEAERWLAGNFLRRLADAGTNTFAGSISHINSGGFTVRLDDNGLEGLVDLRQDPEKFSYDKWTASLTSTTRRFQLHQAVEVIFEGCDTDNQHAALFKLVVDCGLKPAKQTAAETTDSANAG
ncbi:MAG: VacB/RNase II family 3'-5' exoribonuclease [Pseudomonadota bacterium]